MPTYVITTPPATNHLYVNLRRGGRRKSKHYVAWIGGTLKELMAQRARPVQTPVALRFIFPAKMRGDLDGRLKAGIDLLVRGGLIPDDSRKYVQSITADFGTEDSTRVSIEPYVQPAEATP